MDGVEVWGCKGNNVCVCVVGGGGGGGVFFFFSSRRRHTRYIGDWSSDVCSSDLLACASLPASKLIRHQQAKIGFSCITLGVPELFFTPRLGRLFG